MQDRRNDMVIGYIIGVGLCGSMALLAKIQRLESTVSSLRYRLESFERQAHRGSQDEPPPLKVIVVRASESLQ